MTCSQGKYFTESPWWVLHKLTSLVRARRKLHITFVLSSQPPGYLGSFTFNCPRIQRLRFGCLYHESIVHASPAAKRVTFPFVGCRPRELPGSPFQNGSGVCLRQVCASCLVCVLVFCLFMGVVDTSYRVAVVFGASGSIVTSFPMELTSIVSAQHTVVGCQSSPLCRLLGLEASYWR